MRKGCSKLDAGFTIALCGLYFVEFSDEIMPIREIKSMEPVRWNDQKVEWILQNRIPWEETWKKSSSIEELARGIETLEIRGAPVIGIAAAYGIALSASNYNGNDIDEMARHIENDRGRLAKTRPTAVNLFWALDRMSKKTAELVKNSGSVDAIKKGLLAEAVAIQKENTEDSIRMGRNGKDLIQDGDVILTHCNTGPLACGGIGTSTGVILSAWEEGKDFKVIATYTAPLYQGARLTVWEFMKAGVPVTLITDNMAAYAMKNAGITKIFLGADRILMDGQVANKIGTYQLAVLANHHKIPFYVAAPMSTVDSKSSSIPIEMRKPDEVRTVLGKLQITVPDVPVLNPAFDITPPDLVSAIVTEKGIARHPYKKSLSDML